MTKDKNSRRTNNPTASTTSHPPRLRQSGLSRLPLISNYARLALSACLIAGLNGCGGPDGQSRNGIQLDALQAPAGYHVSLLASGLPKARHMALGEKDTLFVGSSDGNVYAISFGATAASGQRRIRTILTGADNLGGIAFRDGALYVAERTRVVRLDHAEDEAVRPAVRTIVDGLSGTPSQSQSQAQSPSKWQTQTQTQTQALHALNFGPDGKLYVAMAGAALSPTCTACPPQIESGSIIRVDTDGKSREVVAQGIRNAAGFDWHPATRELWFTDSGRDDRQTPHGLRAGDQLKSAGEPAAALALGANVAVTGLRFERNSVSTVRTSGTLGGKAKLPMKPPTQASMLIARQGVGGPARNGYDVVRVLVQEGLAPKMEPFLTGFRQGGKAWGRPVDVLTMRDGSVLVSDDINGAIYRVARERSNDGQLSLAVLRRGQMAPFTGTSRPRQSPN